MTRFFPQKGLTDQRRILNAQKTGNWSLKICRYSIVKLYLNEEHTFRIISKIMAIGKATASKEYCMVKRSFLQDILTINNHVDWLMTELHHRLRQWQNQKRSRPSFQIEYQQCVIEERSITDLLWKMAFQTSFIGQKRISSLSNRWYFRKNWLRLAFVLSAPWSYKLE